MQVQVDIEFEQLLEIVKTLPAGQLKLLKAEIGKKRKVNKSKADLETILMNGPVATEKQLEIIESNRKAISQWRTN
ncbi:hypothetical protein [Flavihumibacter profundi]|jgi:hypothetical protein|uniref:hypothetical protein n=1 Tax=Flavihumibacter profundi TaxID=2716883 RepID=UPI001CC4E308|nr:hypothetical protein [Flavihumibacter profundi]MBZ5858378.1 hypothetical protein [Flavihumibacter profundi]